MKGTISILLPTAYFPPAIYYRYLLGERPVFIEQMETYPKQTYRNRCEISTVTGRMNLIIPVSKPYGNHTRTHQVEISYREPWQKKHWRALQTAYSSSPYFDYYADSLLDLFERKEKLLIHHNKKTMETINSLIGIHTEVEFTSDYETSPPHVLDLRNKFKPKNKQLIYQIPRYTQVFEHITGFLPGLSIIDLLFNLGPDSKEYLQRD